MQKYRFSESFVETRDFDIENFDPRKKQNYGKFNNSERRKSNNIQTSKKNFKKTIDWNNKKEVTEEANDGYKIDKPKFELKIASFEMDENEINMANDFVDPDPKYLQNSEYHQLDTFLNIEINNDNYSKVFEPVFIVLDENHSIIAEEINTNEFVEDFYQKLNKSLPKKKDNKMKELKNMDYLIYDVEEKQFYKKIKNDEENDNFKYNGSNNLITGSEKNFTAIERNLKFDSPKIKIKVKKIPLKIIDDHI